MSYNSELCIITNTIKLYSDDKGIELIGNNLDVLQGIKSIKVEGYYGDIKLKLGELPSSYSYPNGCIDFSIKDPIVDIIRECGRLVSSLDYPDSCLDLIQAKSVKLIGNFEKNTEYNITFQNYNILLSKRIDEELFTLWMCA